jgi:hypothetical protein
MEALRGTYTQLSALYEGDERRPIVVCGNRADEPCRVSLEQGRALAAEFNAFAHVETSHVTGRGVEEAFTSLVCSPRVRVCTTGNMIATERTPPVHRCAP